MGGGQHQPKRYNYYVRVPPPPPGDVEAGGGAASEEVSCLICMSPIDLAAVHMETPCHHRFHSACLETVRVHVLASGRGRPSRAACFLPKTAVIRGRTLPPTPPFAPSHPVDAHEARVPHLPGTAARRLTLPSQLLTVRPN